MSQTTRIDEEDNREVNAKRLMGCAVALTGLCLVAVGTTANPSITVTAAVYVDDAVDGALTDLLLSELAQREDVSVVERASIDVLLKEQTLQAVAGDSLQQVRLGQMLGVGYFIWVQQRQELVLVDIVEASTGRGVTTIPMRRDGKDLASMLSAIAQQAVAKAREGLPPVGDASPSLAFSHQRILGKEDANTQVDRFLSTLCNALRGRGIQVLDRQFAGEAVRERWRWEKGFARTGREDDLFMGADYCAALNVDGALAALDLRLVEVRTGRSVGRLAVSFAEAKTAEGCAKIEAWL